MSTDTSRDIARRNLKEVWQQKNLNVLFEICAADIRYHDPASHAVEGIDAYKQYVTAVQNAFPDLSFTIHEMISVDDRVAVRWTFRGTHRGEIRGITPEGREVEFSGMSIYHLQNGVIQEAWINWDTHGYLQQLGAAPARRRRAQA